MRHAITAAILAGFLAAQPAAAADKTAAPQSSQLTPADAGFEVFKQSFVDALFDQFPDWGLEVGQYRGAARLAIPDPASDRAFAQKWLAQLARQPQVKLSGANRIDRAMIDNFLRRKIWEADSFRAGEWDASDWNVGEGISLLLTRDYAPLDARLMAVSERLAKVPDYYAAARRSLRRPTLEHTRLAIRQSRGVLELLHASIEEALAASSLPAARCDDIRARAVLARQAVAAWIADLQSRLPLLEREARSFRIGSALYAQKFAFEIQTDMTPKQLYSEAQVEKERLLAHMDALTRELWPKYFPNQASPAARSERIGKLIDVLSENHVAASDFVPEVKRQIPRLEQWVRDHDLVALDPDKPLQVRETPAHKRGVAGASIDAPGPDDPAPTPRYNGEPQDAQPPATQESTLREYNYWMLQILNIHEAVPGHYVQLIYANRSPSLIKSLLANGAMIEGWAVYAERMMLESGWGDQAPEMWLIYSKWALRVVCNTILDYSVHNLGMTEAQAMRLLREDAFQQEAEAREKWHRAQVSQVQLASYYSGFAAIRALREEVKRREGAAFVLKRFNERFLSYGNAPVKYIRSAMLSTDLSAR